ncbi:MAG: histidinol-phosphate transaminase [Chloroflexota bacterium]
MSDSTETAAAYRGGMSAEEAKSRVKADTIYKMSSNENPWGPSPDAVAAIQQCAAELGVYPPVRDEKLREALSELYGRGLTPDHFITGNSGCDVLELICRAYLQEGDSCIICPPAFPFYRLGALAQKATIINVELQRPDFTYDLDGILAAANENNPKVVFLCTPNNPTGSTLSQADVDYVVENLPAETLIVFDEVYYHFAEPDQHPDALRYVLDNQNMIMLHSFSKAYGLAGLRLGYGIANLAITERIASYRRPYHLNRIAFEAGLAALNDQAHLSKTVDMNKTGRDWLYGQLQELGLKVWPSQSNFLLFQVEGDPQAMTDQLLERGVLVRPAFGLDDCLRVSVGVPEGNQAFIAALTDILAKE